MATVTWKNDVNGNWNVASNWSTGTLPTMGDNVTINTPNPRTITHSTGTDTVLSLTTANNTLAMTGGTLKILGNSNITGGLTETKAAATISFGGARSSIAHTVTQTAGTINVASGMLTLQGSANVLGGTLSGSAVTFSGSTTFRPSLNLTIGHVAVGGGGLTLGASLPYSGSWTQTGPVTLSGRTLTLSGHVDLGAGSAFVGPGNVVLSGTTSVAFVAVKGAATLKNSGPLTVSNGTLSLQSDGTGSAKMTNLAGASINLTGSFANINASTASETLTNAGLIDDTAGAASIGPAIVNTGTIKIETGTMSFLHPVSGKGSIEVGSGATAWFQSSVAAGSAVTLDPYADLTVAAQTAAGGGFGGTIAGFSQGNLIEISGVLGTPQLAFNASTKTLTVTGSNSATTLKLVGSYQASDFYMFTDNFNTAIGHT